jgi:hypothetical protein
LPRGKYNKGEQHEPPHQFAAYQANHHQHCHTRVNMKMESGEAGAIPNPDKGEWYCAGMSMIAAKAGIDCKSKKTARYSLFESASISLTSFEASCPSQRCVCW